MSFLKKLFGGGSSSDGGGPKPATHDYQGFTITPTPQRESGGFRLAATIEKDGQSHQLIRADIIRDQEDCAQAAIAKAKQMIDEQGARLFS